MQKKLIARTAKLLSESKRSRRHQGIAIAYEHIPSDIDERNHGTIYALVNVNAPAASAEEVAELIIDAFHGEYYQDPSKDPLASFETALARVNEELAEITHNGNIHWLNNLNAILAVHTGDTIHLTQTGKAEAYLYRNGKASHITMSSREIISIHCALLSTSLVVNSTKATRSQLFHRESFITSPRTSCRSTSRNSSRKSRSVIWPISWKAITRICNRTVSLS